MTSGSGFAWRDFLPVACALAGQAGEASKRSAIGRAYYAAYGTAEERRKVDGIPKASGDGQHARLWQAYLDDADAARKRIGDIGKRLYSRRLRADYKLGMRNPGREATLATKEARRLLEKLDSL